MIIAQTSDRRVEQEELIKTAHFEDKNYLLNGGWIQVKGDCGKYRGRIRLQLETVWVIKEAQKSLLE